ncbi:MAG: DUF493 domain-containing protein [Deltaproteobacteria bacterium]|nr:MAG: DUF493 domain-containing protein [Deltaproteobacteria bacterium]
MTRNMPSVERLEEVHTFPGPYTFKLFGPNDGTFTEQVRTAALRLVTDAAWIDQSVRPSSGGKHVCVTLDIQVESAHHVRAFYDDFGQIPNLRMML